MIELLSTTIRTYLDGKILQFFYNIIDLVDGTAKMQTRAYNEIAHMLPT